MSDDDIKRLLLERDQVIVIVPCTNGTFMAHVLDKMPPVDLEDLAGSAADACPVEAARIAMERAGE